MPTLFVPPDFGFTYGSMIELTGSICDQFAFIATEEGSRLPDGTLAFGVNGGPGDYTTELRIYDENFTLLVTNTSLIIPDQDIISPITNDRDETFYFAQVDDNVVNDTVLTTITKAGVVGGTTWTLPDSLGTGTIALSVDKSIVYYGRQGSFTARILAYNINTSTALPNLFTGTPEVRLGRDMYVLGDDTILALFRPAVAFPDTCEIRRYDPSGVLLQTYPIGDSVTGIASSPARFAVDPDELSLWVMSFVPTQTVSLFQNIRLSDGALLSSFSLPNTKLGDALGRVAQSCPVLALARDCGGPTPCPGETGTPRTDGLPYTPPVFPPCAGTGTLGLPRTGGIVRRWKPLKAA